MNLKIKVFVLNFSAFLLAMFGFRFVTQMGQGVGVVQNDGYGATGGIMLLVAGLILGYSSTISKDMDKWVKRSDLKNMSKQNIAELKTFARELKDKK